MIDDSKLAILKTTFQRILALPISRATFRDLQNAILVGTASNSQSAAQFLNALLTGDLREASEKPSPVIKAFFEEFSVKTRVAKDVSERGEYLSAITSDTMYHPVTPVFLSRMRRIDGEDFQFLADPQGVLSLIAHFLGRLGDLEKNDSNYDITEKFKNELKEVRTSLDKLVKK